MKRKQLIHSPKLFAATALVCALLALVPAGVYACSCLPQTFEQSVDSAEILARFRVGSFQVIGDSAVGHKYYAATVVEHWKGCNVQIGERVFLRTPIQSATCGVNLNQGDWLLAGFSQGEYRLGRQIIDVNLCSLHRPWNELSETEQKYLCDHEERCRPGPCLDLRNIDFGACHNSLGWGVVRGQCREIRGCSDKGRLLYRTEKECKSKCGQATCDDLAGWDFGQCRAFVGVGVINGKCQRIGGCSNQGFPLWSTTEQCTRACRPTQLPGSGPCPADLPFANCLVDPCQLARRCEGAVRCEANFCGGCHAVWFDANDNVVC